MIKNLKHLYKAKRKNKNIQTNQKNKQQKIKKLLDKNLHQMHKLIKNIC